AGAAQGARAACGSVPGGNAERSLGHPQGRRPAPEGPERAHRRVAADSLLEPHGDGVFRPRRAEPAGPRQDGVEGLMPRRRRATTAPRPPVRVALLGLPTDVNSSHLRGAARAPAEIRKALFSSASNMSSEIGVDLSAPGLLSDQGNLALSEQPEDAGRIERGVAALIQRGFTPLLMGGDHSVTYPVMRAVAAAHRSVSILHFDAHPDLYDVYDGNRLSHACPFARIMEEGLARRLVQVGIRTLNDHQARQA